MSFDLDTALQTKQARTRDGRRVFNLREATLDGQPVLIGFIRTPDNTSIEQAYWESGGLGLHGGDDLMNP